MKDVLKSKATLFWLDGVLPFMPIALFIILGIIGYTYNISGWFVIFVPVIFSGIWVVWHYGIRSKLNILEK